MNRKSMRKLRTTIKQNINLDRYPLDYCKQGVLENKRNATSHPNIYSLKTSDVNLILFEEERAHFVVLDTYIIVNRFKFNLRD